MALTPARWFAAVAVGCAVVVTAFAGRSTDARPARRAVTAERLEYVRINRRTVTATRRWIALSRRDSVVAALAAEGRDDVHAPRLAIDPGLSAGHRTLVERALTRQWKALGIDSALVPVTVAVVVDTVSSQMEPDPMFGEITFDYALATGGEGWSGDRCIVIVALNTERLTRGGSVRRLAELLAPGREAPSLLGPCAFQARFGRAGAGIDAWLRSRSYDLASRPAWQPAPVPALERHDPAVPPQRLFSARVGELYWTLSPEALACTAGALERCNESLAPPRDRPSTYLDGGLVTSARSRDDHWGALGRGYLSDLATTLGPDRFARFWRSDLEPDAALQTVAAMPLTVWTQRWASSAVGPVRTGPAIALRELLGAVVLAGSCVTLTAWGWGRRQVR